MDKKKLLSLIGGIFFIVLIFVYIPNYAPHLLSNPQENDFRVIRVMAELQSNLEVFKNGNNRYPKNIMELVNYLKKSDKWVEGYWVNGITGTVELINIKVTPKKEDKFLPVNSSLIKPGTTAYYVTENLQVYAIYGVDSRNQILRTGENRRKIHYFSNQ